MLQQTQIFLTMSFHLTEVQSITSIFLPVPKKFNVENTRFTEETGQTASISRESDVYSFLNHNFVIIETF